MSYVRNPLMLRDGFVPAADVARALSKSPATVHRMVAAGRAEGVRDGRWIYVRLDPLIELFRSEQNEPLARELVKLKAQMQAELKAQKRERLAKAER